MSDKTAVDDLKAIEGQKPAAVSEDERRRGAAASDYKKAAKDGDDLKMRVRVRSPFRTYYDGDAFSLSAQSATGIFDVLPHHHNFISLLQASELIVRTIDEGEQKFLISGGLLHVKADQVIVFLDI